MFHGINLNTLMHYSVKHSNQKLKIKKKFSHERVEKSKFILHVINFGKSEGNKFLSIAERPFFSLLNIHYSMILLELRSF